jgi:hypothetical protein
MFPSLSPCFRRILLAAAILATAPLAHGATLYVSQLGDNSDGSSWSKGFKSIQKALDSVPDDRGGHRILIRPDTYMEANLYPAQKGAPKAGNILEADFDGALGSGATGYAVIDCSDPEKGFKSYDWYGTIRAYKKNWSPEHQEESFSANGWDRWTLRHLYATGGDGGLFFDLVDQTEPFTVVVEDCVSIGRAFGGGVGNCLSRPEEPITYRRCTLWALDWWGDTAGAYVRVENKTMPEQPDVVFEDCTMAGPQCALKSSNFGFHTFTHARLTRCNLITLNFSQPQGTPTDGIIQSVEEGKLLHVDLEDCTLMGYKVFGVIVKKDTASDISYTTKGDVKAYVQFQQDVPGGMHRLGHWPAEVFSTLLPPEPVRPSGRLILEDSPFNNLCESAPVVWKNNLCLMECVRPATGGTVQDYYLNLTDTKSGQMLARFAEGYGLACGLVEDGTFYAFASRFGEGSWNDVTQFASSDLVHWTKQVVIRQESEHLFNSSVCKAGDGFVMAYESDDPQYPAFTVKFAGSKDLKTWTKMPEALFGKDRYTACPCIRYVDGWYYVLYTEHRTPRWFFETFIARSKDLVDWTLSDRNPVLTPGANGGINASDPDVAEFEGKTIVYYSVGDQHTWAKGKQAVFPGSAKEFFGGYFKIP